MTDSLMDDRKILESVEQNSGDITIAGRVNVWSYNCFSLEFQQLVQKTQSNSHFRRSKCIDNAAFICLQFPSSKFVVGEVLYDGVAMAHCWNRVEGRDVDPAEELVFGGCPAENTYFEIFCGTFDELFAEPLAEDPEHQESFFTWVWRHKVSPGKFQNENHFALGLTKSSYESLERKKSVVFNLKEWEAQEKLQALLIHWASREPSRCENSPEAPNTFWLVDIGEKVTVPDVSFEDIHNTRLITQVIVQTAVQKALDSRKVMEWGLSRFTSKGIYGNANPYYCAISGIRANSALAGLEGTGATAVIALLELYLKVLERDDQA